MKRHITSAITIACIAASLSLLAACTSAEAAKEPARAQSPAPSAFSKSLAEASHGRRALFSAQPDLANQHTQLTYAALASAFLGGSVPINTTLESQLITTDSPAGDVVDEGVGASVPDVEVLEPNIKSPKTIK